MTKESVESALCEKRRIKETQKIVDYCSESMATLENVDKFYLPQLFELKSFSDAVKAK